MPLLVIEDLSVAFTRGTITRNVVDGVSLRIDAGETMALVRRVRLG